MFAKSVVLVFGIVLACANAMVPERLRSLVIGDNMYYHESTVNRNRSQALEYCKAQDGELAKITGKELYEALRNGLPAVGGYWIDGMDKQSAERFEANQTCTDGGISFAGIPKENIDLQATTCLSLQKNTTAKSSKIQAVACSTQLKGVICSSPLKGCKEEVTTTTTPAGNGVLFRTTPSVDF